MTTQKTQTQSKDFWDSVRDSLVTGMRDLRDRGDDLARQGRLRMDLMQAERRLRQAHEALGEATYNRMLTDDAIESSDPKFVELRERVRYYADEMTRLRNDLRQEVTAHH